jgi:hypothetical protein
MKRKKVMTIVSDRDCIYYVIPEAKEAKFQAWEASVIGGENDEYMDENYEMTGENFLDYQIDRPLATLMLSNRRLARRRARRRGLRDVRDN